MPSLINNFTAPKTMDDLLYFYGNGLSLNLSVLLSDGDSTGWTVPSNCIPGDIVYFYCARSSVDYLRRLRKQTQDPDILEYIDKELALHKEYAGHIVAVGEVFEKPYKIHDRQWFAFIGNLCILKKPVIYDDFKPFIKISNFGAFTRLNDDQVIKLDEIIQNEGNNLPKVESLSSQVIVEGSRKIAYYGTKYERDPKVRKAFLATQSKPYTCAVCGFSFESMYGDLGADVIDVHHKLPLSLGGAEQPINSATDLVCLCCNCHRMIHKLKGQIMTVEDLKKTLQK